MTPETVHFIAQTIRHVRALFTITERWLHAHSKVDATEAYLVINFWRWVLKAAEDRLVSRSTD